MIFEISTFKLAKISSKILDTKKKFFFVEMCNNLGACDGSIQPIFYKGFDHFSL